MKLRRLLAVTAVAIAAVGFSACGNKEEVTTFGLTEGTYLTVDGVGYQVQISRLLNPKDNTDKSYLIDVPADQRELAPDEAWFAVFVVGFNNSDTPREAVTDFKITDTQGNVYTPIPIGPNNVFAWRPGTIEPGSTKPQPNTAARNNPSVQGAMLLFKMQNSTFDNRPLLLHLRSMQGEPNSATVTLDV
jgi:hypothetical protein